MIKDILQWYDSKDVVPTKEAMEKSFHFYRNKGIEMLKLGFTLPDLADFCRPKSTKIKSYPFCEIDKDLGEKR